MPIRGVKVEDPRKKDYDRIPDLKHLDFCINCEKETCNGVCEKVRKC